MKITIDTEFEGLVQPLSFDERGQLERNLKQEGCRDALVVWRGILLDGHNRYEICKRLGIPFRTVDMVLPNREAAINWIIDNQLGRRNLTPEQMSYLRGKRYNQEKKEQGGDRKSCDQNDHMNERTADRLADRFKVSAPTIRRDAVFAQAVDTIAENTEPDTRKLILSGETPFTKQEVIQIAQKPPEEQRAAIWPIKNPALFTSETPEWYTPDLIVDRVRMVLGVIDIDPCSNSKENPRIPAREHYTKDDDGLSREWKGTVYMNPPYGREIGDWTGYLKEQYEQGNVTEAIALVPSRTDTEWFKELRRYPRCFIWGRLKFSESENSAPFPSMAVYLGEHLDAFAGAFRDIGDIYRIV